ncbi:MAG: nitroreductase family protein [Christensenellales bacterium]|jgi:nitroreductase
MERDYNYDIMPEIKTRYATRVFDSAKVTRQDLLPLFEAARYAPSCFNEQPWRFIIADDAESHEKLAQALSPGNAWAKKAPVLVLTMCTRTFKMNGSKNPFSRFDTGTSTGFLQLEAIRQGFSVHSMGGFSADKARELFNIPEDLDIIDMIAIGRPANLNELPEEVRKNEIPGTRMPLDDIIWK